MTAPARGRPVVSVAPGQRQGCVFACAQEEEATVVRLGGLPGHFVCWERYPADRELPAGMTWPAEAEATGQAEKAAPAGTVPARRPSFRFLEDLRDRFPPRMRVDGKLKEPYWRPPMPEITDRVTTSSWSWKLPSWDGGGRFAVLDRTAAYLSAMSSVEVAWSDLVEESLERFTGLPGFYKVQVLPWLESGLPHPLGSVGDREAGTEVWVPHPRAELLQGLADAGRYPDGFITGAYTCGINEEGRPRKVRLTEWAKHMRDARAQVIADFGRYDPDAGDGQTEAYRYVKTRISQARTMMTGRWEPGKGRSYDPTVKVRRADWGLAVEDQSAVTLWRAADDCRQIAVQAGMAELAPLALRNVDELLVPEQAVELITSTPRPGGRRPLVVDPSGIALGTFKVKKAA